MSIRTTIIYCIFLAALDRISCYAEVLTKFLGQCSLSFYIFINLCIVNVTAYNLHSEPILGYVGYTHNLTRYSY